MNDGFGPILQDRLPVGQADVAVARLPSMRPVVGHWLSIDDGYGGQMALWRRLLRDHEDDVYAQLPGGLVAARGFVETALGALPAGFKRSGDQVVCPDGYVGAVDWDAPLRSIGKLLQQDVCILEKSGPEHVLTGAVLCFPASWTLAQKIGKPLVRIHNPVAEYDDKIATRVQRMFDGVQVGRPMWRANLLRYADATLFQPRPEHDPRPIGGPDARFFRSERQTVLRLSEADAVAFVIHTTVVRAREMAGLKQGG